MKATELKCHVEGMLDPPGSFKRRFTGHRTLTASLWFTCLSTAFLLAACKHSPTDKAQSSASPTVAPPTTGSGSAKVSYRPNVHVVEQEAGTRAIQGVSTNGAALLLDATDPQVQSLKEGDVLVVKGLLAKKIIGTEVEGSSLLVLTQPASLVEAVQDGKIQVSAPVRFGVVRAANESPKLPGSFLDRLIPPVYAQSPDGQALKDSEAKEQKDVYGNILGGITGAIIDGWTTDFSTTPGDGRLNINITMKKNVGGFVALITGEGYISNFDFDSNIGVENSSYQNIDAGLKKLNGQMNFKWEVSTDTPGVRAGQDRIKLPAGIDIPLYQYLDGLPLYLEISSALLIEPALTGGKEYSRGAFRITYDGYQHFSGKTGVIDSDGKVTGDIQFLESQNISAIAPMGMIVAFAAPRIELTFGVSKVFPFKGMKEAASKVDLLAEQLAKRILTPEQYAQYKSSPMGDFTFSNAIEMANKSDAEAFFEMVSSAGVSFTGVSAVTPCTRHDIQLSGKVGVSAEVMGVELGKSEKDIYQKDFTRIDPPGTKLCESVGQSG